MHYVDRVFIDEDITLDGNTFDRCVFDGCVLRYNGGSIELIGGLSIRNGGNLKFGAGVDAADNPLTRYIVAGLNQQGATWLTDEEVAGKLPVAPKHDTG